MTATASSAKAGYSIGMGFDCMLRSVALPLYRGFCAVRLSGPTRFGARAGQIEYLESPTGCYRSEDDEGLWSEP